MAESGFSFLKDILFTPASVRAQNNADALINAKNAQVGGARGRVMQRLGELQKGGGRPDQILSQLMNDPVFIDAFTQDPDIAGLARDMSGALGAPKPMEVSPGASLVRENGQGGYESVYTAPAKGTLGEDEKEIARLQEVGFTRDQAIKYNSKLASVVDGRDPVTGKVTFYLRDMSDPENPKVTIITPEQAKAASSMQAPEQQPAQPTAAEQAPGAAQGRNGIPAYGITLLNAIAGTESPGYNVMNGGQRFSDMSRHPLRKGQAAKGGTTSASGRYQFVRGTWDRAAAALGLKDFSPESQDRAAWWLAQQDYKANTGRDLDQDLQAGNIEQVRRGLQSTWRGLADNPAKFNKAMGIKGGTTGAENFKPGPGDTVVNAQGEQVQGPGLKNKAEMFLGTGYVPAAQSALGGMARQFIDQESTIGQDASLRRNALDQYKYNLQNLNLGSDQISKAEREQIEAMAPDETSIATDPQAALQQARQQRKFVEELRDSYGVQTMDESLAPEVIKGLQKKMSGLQTLLDSMPTEQEMAQLQEGLASGGQRAPSVSDLISDVGTLFAPAQKAGAALIHDVQQVGEQALTDYTKLDLAGVQSALQELEAQRGTLDPAELKRRAQNLRKRYIELNPNHNLGK